MLSVAQLFQKLEVEPNEVSPETELTGLKTLDEAGSSDISFFHRPKFKGKARKSGAAIILIPDSMEFADPRALAVPNIWTALLTLLDIYYPPRKFEPGIHPTAVLEDGSEVGENVHIGAHSVIESGAKIGDGSVIQPQSFIGRGAVIGRNCRIHSRVTLGDQCKLGDRVILHSGCVIGADGFRYERINQMATKIPQVGIVNIHDDVEIGANTTIDRASFASTVIGARTKIDNLVQIAHNVVIGSDCIIVSQAGVAGSTKLGRGVVLGGQVGIADNTTIGDGTQVGGQSGVKGYIKPGSELLGSPATDARTMMSIIRIQRRLPEIYEKIRPFLEGEIGGESDL